MIDKLKEMLEMQAKLDEAIFAEHGTSYEEILEGNGFFWAILDELGEWTHERKPEWCWWKKEKKPVNRQKELEEFVDTLHFAMSRDLAAWDGLKDGIHWSIFPFTIEGELLTESRKNLSLEKRISWFLYRLAEPTNINKPTMTGQALSIAQAVGYSFDEIYEAYMAKNKVNFERLANGY